MTTNSSPAPLARKEPYHTVRQYEQRPVWRLGTEFLQHEQMGSHILQYCATMNQEPSPRKSSNKIFAQQFRYMTCFNLISNYMSWKRGEGKPPTLKALQETVSASPRHVADLIAALRDSGHVTAQRQATDRRSIYLIPSPKLLLEVARSPLSFLKISESIRPADRSLADLLVGNSDLLALWIARSIEEFKKLDIVFRPFPNVVQFSTRDAGYLILTAVIGSYYSKIHQDEPWHGDLAPENLAGRFGVSRQHVRNLFSEAKENGVFAVSSGQLSEISPALVDEFETWSVGQMAHYRLLAEEMRDLAETETISAHL
ncbi:hypothetical protein J2046_005750 [Rhizobium petrolearium]|uniref:MarR family transcriptional regulator n=1 Tax=Neorhizobium petrolearium TaxID=515361 RepID=UPI001FDCF0EC|nr:hypothetical protein [Neorhizobium petrolearium]